MYGNGKEPLFILTLLSNGIQPPRTEGPMALRNFRGKSTGLMRNLETKCRYVSFLSQTNPSPYLFHVDYIFKVISLSSCEYKI